MAWTYDQVDMWQPQQQEACLLGTCLQHREGPSLSNGFLSTPRPSEPLRPHRTLLQQPRALAFSLPLNSDLR